MNNHGTESKMLCFHSKCIAKFGVFPDLELTPSEQILQVALLLLASPKPKMQVTQKMTVGP